MESPDCRSILKTDLFSTLLGLEQFFVISRSSIMNLSTGEALFSPGDRANHFYQLLEGQIRIFKKRSDDDGEDEMAQFNAGDTIGDCALARRAEYDVYAVAVKDSVLVMFPGKGNNLDDLAVISPNTIIKILHRSVIMMTERITSTRRILLENISWVHELQRKAYEDPGTGLWKHSFLSDEINNILEDNTALIMLKPDRFKILVDSRGHGAGDDAMVHIANVLRNITRKLDRGWPLRFKSNETGLFINKCTETEAETIANELAEAIADLPPVPAEGDIPSFPFTGTVIWSLWPNNNYYWDDLFKGSYDLLLAASKTGGNKVLRYFAQEAGLGNQKGIINKTGEKV
jgi:diguanylate cyclase (GGDEF)-like protein